MNVLDSIKSHAELEPGWLNGRGGPLTEKVIKAGLQLCYGILSDDYSIEDLEDFPLEDGRLMVVFYSEIDYQFIISTDQLLRVITVKDGKHIKIADGLTVKAAIELFKQCKKWPTFAFFISGSLVNDRAAISGGIVSCPPVTANCRWYYYPASMPPPEAYAHTQENFIPLLQENPYSSLNCFQPNFLRTLKSNKKQKTRTNATTTLADVKSKARWTSPEYSLGTTWLGSEFAMEQEMVPLTTNSYAGSKMTLTLGKPSVSKTGSLGYKK